MDGLLSFANPLQESIRMHTQMKTASNTAANPAPDSAIDSVIDSAFSERRLVGAVVMVARHGQPVYQRAAGFADRETGQAMQHDTLFRLASVSKPIISTAAMVLVGQGKMALDDDIARWLPEFQPRLADGSPARISVRQLLSHTAGLGYRFFEADEHGPYALAGVSDGMDHSGLTLTENLRRIASVPLRYAPGSAWGYSLATDVLGALIERVCQLPLAQATALLVTTPLGMHDTGFHVTDRARLATPYVNDTPLPRRMQETEVVPAFENTVGIRYHPARAFDPQAFPSGGAGMIGCAGDFMRLLEILRSGGGSLLPAALTDAMGSIQRGAESLPDTPGVGFGLGFSVLHDALAAASPESPGTWRWGGAYGHSWFVDRARGLSVVAFTNTLYEGMSGRFVNDLRDAVYQQLATAQLTEQAA